MNKLLNTSLRIASVFSAMLIAVFFSANSIALADAAQDAEAVFQESWAYDPTSSSCNADGGGNQFLNPVRGGELYVIGDSITVGMQSAGDLETKLTAAGWVPTINAVGGKNLGWGREQVVANASTIANSKSILIALGTNNSGNAVTNDGQPTERPGGKDDIKNQMQEIVDAVRQSNRSIYIYWTSVYMEGTLSTPNGDFDLATATSVINEALSEVACANDISILPWGTSTEAPLYIAGELEDTGYGIHPQGHYPETADYIVQQLASARPSCGNGPSTAPVSTIPPTGTMALVGADNIEKVWNFAHWAGLNDVQAAGLMGNIYRESNFDPTAVNPSSGAYGLAQWLGGRLTNLQNQASSQGIPVEDLSFQLIFLYNESSQERNVRQSQHPSGTFTNPTNAEVGSTLSEWEGLKRMETVEAAARYWEWNFERADDPESGMTVRINKAQEYFDRFNGQIAPPAGAGGETCVSPNGPTNGNVTTDGYAWPVEPQQKVGYYGMPCTGGPTSCHHDNTAAFDLAYAPEGSISGKSVYAIYPGEIAKVGIVEQGWCYSIQFKGDDGKFYFYGHLNNVSVVDGQRVTAGQTIAEVADWTESHTCNGTSSGDHLHIDRGCFRDGEWRWGGGDRSYTGEPPECRDPEFITLMNMLYEALPTP